VENLEVLISLNYGEINTCKLIYNNQTLKDKEVKLRDVVAYVEKKESEPEIVYEIKVTKKGEFDEISDVVEKLKASAQNNPLIFAGVVVSVLFLILFLMGSASEEQQFY
jgi:hypothetical protein